MNITSENRYIMKDLMSLMGIILVTAATFFCNYYYSISGPVQSIVWITWLVLVLILGYLTAKGKQVYQFALDAKIELLKVVWPTRQETIQTTSIVMIMVTLTGFILWAIDSVMMWAIAKITHLG